MLRFCGLLPVYHSKRETLMEGAVETPMAMHPLQASFLIWKLFSDEQLLQKARSRLTAAAHSLVASHGTREEDAYLFCLLIGNGHTALPFFCSILINFYSALLKTLKICSTSLLHFFKTNNRLQRNSRSVFEPWHQNSQLGIDLLT